MQLRMFESLVESDSVRHKTGQSRTLPISVGLHVEIILIVANIAEGSAKRGPKEFRRYLDISIGSLSELTTLLLLARALGFLSEQDSLAVEPTRKRAAFLLWRLYRSVS